MANYVIYTYQFAPLSNDGQKLFEDLPSVTERMEMKQVYLQDILANEHFKFKSVREGVFDYQRRYNRDGIIIFKLANNKRLNLEEHFQKKRHDYSPSCFVIIDNRHNIQHIAIEEDSTAFSSTDVVKNIIEFSLRKALKAYGLTISIKKEYQTSEFWYLLEQYPNGASMVRFHFSYPNLPRVCDSINELISNQSRLTNSQETTFELKSSNTEHLILSNDNEQLNGLIDASAKSGNVITFKMKGIRKYVKTGTSIKSFEIDDLAFQIQDNELFKSVPESLVELLNRMK